MNNRQSQTSRKAICLLLVTSILALMTPTILSMTVNSQIPINHQTHFENQPISKINDLIERIANRPTLKSIFQSQSGPLQPQPFTAAQQALISYANSTLTSHLVEGTKWDMPYHFYRPGLQKYGPYQWLWDSAFHMITWSRINKTNAVLDLLTMLRKQNNNGRIAEMVFWGPQSKKDKILNKLLLSDPTQTDITQMPMLPLSLERIYSATKDDTLLAYAVPKLIQYHQWWANNKQPDNDGLVAIIHPWESGLDASPMYDEALAVQNPQPTLKELYPHFQELLLSYKFKYNWKLNRIYAPKSHSPRQKWASYFSIKEVGVNSVYTYGWYVLSQLSLKVNNTKMSDYCLHQYRHFLKGLLSLWDPTKKMFTSMYLDGNQYKRTRANTVQSIMPIMVPDLTAEQKELILSQLKDPRHYYTACPIPSVSLSDPAYNPVFSIDLMWRGPSWAAPTYFILLGLQTHNQLSLYRQIATKWVGCVLNKQQTNVWEMWNASTGDGYGVKGLGMSMVVVQVMYKLKGWK